MSGNVEPEANPHTHETLLTLASLGLIAEHVGQPVYAKNRQLKLVLVNHLFCELVGFSREELLGKSEHELSGEELAKAHENSDREVFDQEQLVTVQQQFQKRGAGSHERPTTKLPLTDSNSRVTHIVCVVGRAGEAAASEQQLQQELERYAQERTRALKSVQDQLLRKERLMVLGQLAAGLAHQIRNPLGAISNAIALARRQVRKLENPMIEDALQIASEEIWEANRIIGDLLDYARIRPPQRTECSLLQVVSAAVDSEPLPDDVSVELQNIDITVHVDARQVRDGIRNLVRNAVEAMNEKGTITFSARTVGGFAELLVQDTGVGVADEHKTLLFEPLVTSKPLGIGLGLPTARALISNQGGSLECMEATEPGACFLMRLPTSPPVEPDDAD